MTDEEFDSTAIDNAFSSFRGGPDLPAPIGAAAVRATVRRRRQVRAGVTGGLAALLIAAPVAAYAAGVIGTNGPPGGEVATQPPSPTATVPTPTPSPSPTTSPSPGASVGAGVPPDGRIDDATLKGAVLNLPGWTHQAMDSCPAGDYEFTDGVAPNARGADLRIEDSVYVDVDSDGAEETAVVLWCRIGQGGEDQVVVFDRDESGNIVTVGSVVVAQAKDGFAPGLPATVRGIRAAGNAVEVEVGDIATCCGLPDALTNWQWRAYTLDGDTFRQTGGPTEFGPNPKINDLRVASVTMDGTTTGDTFAGTLRISIRNAGPSPANAVVGFALPPGATLKNVPMGCKRDDALVHSSQWSADAAAAHYYCTMGPTAPGGDVTLETFEVTGPAASFPAGAEKKVEVHVVAGVEGSTWPSTGDVLPDADGTNNVSTVTFTVK